MWIRTQSGKLLNDHYVYTFSLKAEPHAETVEPWWRVVAEMREGKTETVFEGHREKCVEMLEGISHHTTIGATTCTMIPKRMANAKADTTDPA